MASIEKEHLSVSFRKKYPQFIDSLFSHIAEEVLVLSQDSTIVAANEAAARGFGEKLENFVGKELIQFLSDQPSLEDWEEGYVNNIKQKKMTSFVLHRLSKKGKSQYLEVQASNMKFGKENLFVFSEHPVVDEAQSKEQKKIYDFSLFADQQVSEGVVVLSLNGVVLYGNKKAAELSGVAYTQFLGKKMDQFVGQDSRREFRTSLAKIRSGAFGLVRGKATLSYKRKTKKVEFTAAPIYRDGKMRYLHFFIRDVSHIGTGHNGQKEESLKVLQSYISGTTREICYPLKGLLDRIDSLVQKYKSRDFEYIGYKEFRNIISNLEGIHKEVKHCLKTTDRVLSLKKKQAGLRESCSNVNEVIHEALSAVRHHQEVNEAKIHVKCSGNFPKAAIDPLDLSQVMVNILTNAIQALPRQGNIYLKTSFHQATDRILIECRDDGIGIPREDLPRIFDPFFTTKQRGFEKSSGLGLAIVHAILEKNHCEITVNSRLRYGTNIKIILPVYHSLQKLKKIS
jgi:PAS domain S-box-containing protein